MCLIRALAKVGVSLVLLIFTCHTELVYGIEEIIEIQATNFEMVLTSYRYAAILFHDANTPHLLDEWRKAVESPTIKAISDSECIMAHMDAEDPEIEEVKLTYALSTPGIKVFRRGIMSDWRGPFEAEAIAAYVREDSKPSVVMMDSVSEIKATLLKRNKTIVIGFFNEDDLNTAGAGNSEGFSSPPWEQFLAAADSLRDHAEFRGVANEEITTSFNVDLSRGPQILLITERAEGFVSYTGELLEPNIAEWVLRNSQPAMGELTFASQAGEIFATQFFSSKKLKFILVVKPEQLLTTDLKDGRSVVEAWSTVAMGFKGDALFAYMVEEVADVMEYFRIDAANDLPVLVAHNPVYDHKFKSDRLDSLDAKTMGGFVAGVIDGDIRRILKSQNPPAVPATKGVVVAVGSTVTNLVEEADKDVLLLVYSPQDATCKKLRATYEMLAKAVQSEPKFVIAKIDGTSNDFPGTWDVKAFPTILLFKAEDKKKSIFKPKSYWNTGYSLYELFGFLVREGSFDSRMLTIATNEQLGSLLGDEEILQAEYEELERWERRNEGREINEVFILDYLYGEVVFDGHRWHLVLVGALGLACVVLLLLVMSLINKQATKKSKNKDKNGKEKTEGGIEKKD